MPWWFRAFVLAAVVWAALSGSLAAQSNAPAGGLPTPEEFAGFPIGSEGNLVRWERIVEYFHRVAAHSDRVLVEELGKTTQGNPFILATISSPENLARLAEIKARQREIAYPYEMTAERASELAWSSPAVVLITCNVHATEIASSQMALELVHRLATEDSRWAGNVLDHVVLLLAPSLNPDGQIIVTDWNDRIRGTKHVWAKLPWLYHPYAGHDNNRDAFLMTQIESRYINRVLFQEWFPQVYLDQHQQGNSGMRVFVPPFRNPINPNVDPLIWAEAGLFGFAMFTALHEAGFSGATYDQRYTAWWQGGFLRSAWFHNVVGVLSEVASANLASPVYQQQAQLGVPPRGSSSRNDWHQQRSKDPAALAPPPSDVVPRYNYPRPWLGGKWTLRDVIDYELVLTDALLETAANHRVRLIENQIQMGKTAIEQGSNGEPYAYLIPPGQHDPGTAADLLEALHFTGIEIHRALEDFAAGGRHLPKGTFVILMAQPFRAYAKDLLESQDHPDPEQLPLGAMNDEPYDVTAWTLPLQMGVEAIRVKDSFQARLQRLDSVPVPPGRLLSGSGASQGFLISPEPNKLAIAANRLLKAGARVYWLTGETELNDDIYPPGSLWVRGEGMEGKVEPLVRELGLRGAALPQAPRSKVRQLAEPRVALYQPWTASIDEGWTRWLLETYEFRFATVRDTDIQGGKLRRKWDAIILPGDRGKSELMKGRESESTPPEFRGGLGQTGRDNLRKFVAAGGTLITMGDSTEFALRWFALPLKNALEGLNRAQFTCPGSFLRILVDTQHPIAYGMRNEATAVFVNNAAFEAAPGFSYTDLQVIARYPGGDLLQSGWMRGPEHLHHRIAAAEVGYKKGRIILIGFRPQFRAQSQNTFKLLFNALYHAAAGQPMAAEAAE